MAMNTPGVTEVLSGISRPGAAAASTAPAGTPDQLRTLAAQFESVLISQMLQQMRSSLFDDEETSGFGSGPLGDTMFSELSLALSRAGGVGLSESLLEPLLRQAGVSADAASAWTGATAAPNTMMDLPTSLPAVEVPAEARGALFDGRLSSAFGWRQHPVTGLSAFHKGVDIAMPVGRDVPSAQGGRVTFAGEQGTYGLTVVIDHGQGVSTRYAHLSEITVASGDAVTEGQTIGLSGATGRVTGAHLHFEVLENGQPVEPAAGVGRLYARR